MNLVGTPFLFSYTNYFIAVCGQKMVRPNMLDATQFAPAVVPLVICTLMVHALVRTVVKMCMRASAYLKKRSFEFVLARIATIYGIWKQWNQRVHGSNTFIS